jgi:Fe2+ transport system protein FeoA
MKHRIWLITVLAVLLSGVGAWAQLTATTTITGTIVDQSGSARAGLRMYVVNTIKDGVTVDTALPKEFISTTGGAITLTVLRQSTVYLWAPDSSYWNRNGRAGVPVVIQDVPSVTLESITLLASLFQQQGDTVAAGANGRPTRISGNTTSTPKFYGQVGASGTPGLPAWWTIEGTPVTFDTNNRKILISSTGAGGAAGAPVYYNNTAASYQRTTTVAYIAADATSAAQVIDLGVTAGLPVEVFKADTTANPITINYNASSLTLRYTGAWAKFVPNGSTWVLWSFDPTSGGVAADAGYAYVATLTYSVPNGIGYVDCDATSNAVAISLVSPNAAAVEVRKSDTSNNACTINYNATSLPLTTTGGWAKFVPNGATWVLLSRTQ